MCTIVYKKYSVDSKSLSTLALVLFWLVLGIIVCFIGIKNTYAATYTPDNFTAQLFDNINGSLSYQETNNEIVDNKNIYYYGFINNLVANSAGGAWGISSPIPLINNHTYSMTVKTQVVGCGTTQLSNINRIGIGPDMGFAKYAYENNQYAEELYSKTLNSNLLQFVFKAKTDSSYIIFPFSTSSSCSNKEVVLYDIAIEDLGSDGITQNEINTSLNNQTNTINNSIQNSTDTITDEINDMEQSIIDSNKETQDVIKDQFNSCRDSVNLAYSVNYSAGTANYWSLVSVTSTEIVEGETYTASVYLDSEGDSIVYWNDVSGVLPYKGFRISKGLNRYTYTFTAKKSASNISIILSKSDTNDNYLITPSKLQIQKGDIATEFELPNTEICTNKLDDTNDKLNDLNNSLNNPNVDDSLGSAGNFFDNFNTSDHGGLSGIITAPLVAINQMLNTSCSPMTTTFKGKELSLPCGYEFWNKMGPIQDFVNLVLGGLLCYQIIIKLYKLIEKIKNPEDDRLEVMDL